ncbi:hypothetical protein C8Q77DRAFT_1153905 [Trametes polyzona]|nr:hypothetical protein C8Q77DRAFT_1153905 [Trametes polyzona]
MSDKATQSAPAAGQTGVTPPAKDDTQSILSDTSTLAGDKKASKDTKGDASSSKGKGDAATSGKSDAKLDSATAFAKEASKKGWAAPTATRPTFG